MRKQLTAEQMNNFKVAMERINAIDSVETFDDAKTGAKSHTIKTLTYLIKNKEVNEINHFLLDLYDLTEKDVSDSVKMMEVIKELDAYQLKVMGQYLDLTNKNVVDFFDYVKELTVEFEAELEKAIA